MKSIGFKISIFYILLIIINISFFTLFIFENQMELIVENAKYKSLEIAQDILFSLNTVIMDMKEFNEDFDDKQTVITKLNFFLDKIMDEYIYYSAEGEVYYQSSEKLPLTPDYKTKAARAIANNELFGDMFYSEVDQSRNYIYFHIPFNAPVLEDSVLLFRMKISNLGDFLNNFYRLLFLLIAGIVIVHIIFGLIILRLFISPVQKLDIASKSFAEGDFAVRVPENRSDEIGNLSRAFNFMAASIQSKIDELEKLNEMKDEFVGIVAHDIRSPFANIIGLLSVLAMDRDIDLTDEYREMIKNMIISSTDIIEMINKLLNIASFERGNIKIEKEEVNLREITAQSYKKLEYTFKTKGVRFILEVNEDCIASADKVWIKEVLINLISNSLKFTDRKGYVMVTGIREVNSHVINVTVEDNGTGIPEKILPDLLNKHIKTSTRGLQGEKGAGFGLPLCREIIELHGGRLNVESREGKGTKIHFTLPVFKKNGNN